MCFVVILHDNVDLYPLTFSPHKISTFVRDFCCVWYVWLMAVDINKQFSIQNREQEKNCFFFHSRYAFAACMISFLFLFCWHFFSLFFFICIHLVVDKLESALVTIFLYVLLQHFRTNLLGKKKTKKNIQTHSHMYRLSNPGLIDQYTKKKKQ